MRGRYYVNFVATRSLAHGNSNFGSWLFCFESIIIMSSQFGIVDTKPGLLQFIQSQTGSTGPESSTMS